MEDNTLAEAANTNTMTGEAPVATPGTHETQVPDAVAQHTLLAEQLADPNWSPEAKW